MDARKHFDEIADDFAQRFLHDLIVRNQGLKGFIAHRLSW